MPLHSELRYQDIIQMLRQWFLYACFYSDNFIIIVNMFEGVVGLNEPLVLLN